MIPLFQIAPPRQARLPFANPMWPCHYLLTHTRAGSLISSVPVIAGRNYPHVCAHMCVHVCDIRARVHVLCQPRGRSLSPARRRFHHWTDGQHPPFSSTSLPFIFPLFHSSITVFLSCGPSCGHPSRRSPRRPPPSNPS